MLTAVGFKAVLVEEADRNRKPSNPFGRGNPMTASEGMKSITVLGDQQGATSPPVLSERFGQGRGLGLVSDLVRGDKGASVNGLVYEVAVVAHKRGRWRGRTRR